MTAAAGPVTLEIVGHAAIVTLDRPEARNALSSEVVRTLPTVVAEASEDERVAAIILTGRDPAFCAGLDLRELGTTGENLRLPDDITWPWRTDKPVMAAVNGPAVAGGLELALHCDLLVASERALFGDTHAAVGQLPGAGLTVRLPAAVGFGRALRMSLTGRFVDAATAERWGLVTEVVPHEDLLPRVLEIADDVARLDGHVAAALTALYRDVAAVAPDHGLALEGRRAAAWQRSFRPADVEARRPGILDRGSSQVRDAATPSP